MKFYRSSIASGFCVILGMVAYAACSSSGSAKNNSTGTFTVVEASIADMQAAMANGQVTSHQIVQEYLNRIGQYDPELHGVMTVSPTALQDADALDAERAQGHVRGPLHGIPIAFKDIIQTTNMPTSGGALALKGFIPPYEATVVTNLRNAGAIILAKTTLTELGNFVSTTMPDHFSGAGGFGFNPYDPRLDPRTDDAGTPYGDGRGAMTTGASSSGVGTAANFWAANVGEETSGSIMGPSSRCMLVGIKTTVGRVSRYGVIPGTRDQDTLGPMAKTVADAATLLGAMESVDPNDPATGALAAEPQCAPPPNHDYTIHLKADGLQGARIGIPRAYFYNPVTVGGQVQPSQLQSIGYPPGSLAAVDGLMTKAIAALSAAGATIIDPADFQSITEPESPQAPNFLNWPQCTNQTSANNANANCTMAVEYRIKSDLNTWLATLGPNAPVHSLTDLRNFNAANSNTAIKYGQDQLDAADSVDLNADLPRYTADRAKDVEMTTTRGLDALFQANQLDAVLFPTDTAWDFADRPGYPSITVPIGTIPNPGTVNGASSTVPFPDSFGALPQPFGVTFTGLACSEGRLIEIAYAFEQATRARVPSSQFP